LSIYPLHFAIHIFYLNLMRFSSFHLMLAKPLRTSKKKRLQDSDCQ
jgi:hypothetical protein